MASPLAPQTVLQNRYRLLQLLAEGGFARTYLAEDQGRFGERCVVKEFCPPANDAAVFEKANELFQREAQTLYRLDHSQVPRFRAMFAEAVGEVQSLFLVQDWVDGKTFRALLQDRLAQDRRFTEPEIRQFLAQLLPVLDYIHGQGIIHRDLSLDNLMQRTADQLPVLIDFGVVKTVVSQLQRTNVMQTGTVVGKFGYAPIEQIQSGRAYPSSDLYSLAVCCLVLLTGLDPSQLFDDRTAAWSWRSQAQVSDALASVLDRMLAHKPSDRYATAREALQALTQHPPEQSPNTPPRHSAPVAPKADSGEVISQMGTIAVSAPEQRPPQRNVAPKPKPTIPPVYKPKAKAISRPAQRGPSTGILLFAGAITAVVSAAAGWWLMQFLMQRPLDKEQLFTPTPSPIATRSPQPTTPSTVQYSQSLNLAPGQAVTVTGNLSLGEALIYRVAGNAGDMLSAQLTGKGMTLTVMGEDLTALGEAGASATGWKGTLPASSYYYLRVQNDSASDGTLSDASFALAVSLSQPAAPLPTPSSSPENTSSPSPSPLIPTVDTTSLSLTPQSGAQSLNGTIAAGHVQRYSVTVEAGQALSAAVTGNQSVTLTVRNAAGEPLDGAQNVLNWDALVPEPGTYTIDVVPVDGTQATSFAVDIGLKQAG
ncbi:MAG TPA: protein kinase [Stenomitos sp.]